jgi:hypothetical protein
MIYSFIIPLAKYTTQEVCTGSSFPMKNLSTFFTKGQVATMGYDRVVISFCFFTKKLSWRVLSKAIGNDNIYQ